MYQCAVRFIVVSIVVLVAHVGLAPPAAAQGPIESLQARYRQLFEAGDYRAAVEPAQRALALLRQGYGPQSNELAVGLNDLALILNRAGRPREAAGTIREAVAIWEARRDPGQAGGGYGTLGQIELALGRLPEAEAAMRNSLALREQAFGPEHADVALALNDLAAVLETAGQLAEAGTVYQRALAMGERVHGLISAEVAQTASNLGVLKQKSGDFASAESLYKRSLEIFVRMLRTDRPQALTTRANLGLLYQESGRADEAVLTLEPVLQAFLRLAGPAHPVVANIRNNLAIAYQSLGRPDDAARELELALPVLTSTLGSVHQDIAQALNTLGVVRLHQGRPQDALVHLERALAMRREIDTPSAQLAEVLTNLGTVEVLLERYETAEQKLAEAARRFSETLGDKHPNLVRALGNWGGALMALGRKREAVDVFRRVSGLVGERPWLERSSGQISSSLAQSGARNLRPVELERGYLKMYVQALAGRVGEDTSLIDEAFKAAQRAIDNPASEAISQLGSRFAYGKSRVALQIREMQQALARKPALERALTRKRIRRGTFTSVAELEDAIHDYLLRHNAKPKPFVWTKTAERILETERRALEKLEAVVPGIEPPRDRADLTCRLG